ncbi:MAG: B12-binding domain-containing radical SAM protein [Candidatus Hodarchaeota archaeon]
MMAIETLKPYSRILLVSPAGPSGLSFALHPVPLGLECIAAVIRDDVEDVMIYDQFLDKEPFANVLVNFKPDLVGFSLSATEHNAAKELIKKVRKYNPDVPIITGGFHPTGAPELVLNDLNSDVACRGEGEAVFKEIIEGKPWAEIKGISYKELGNGNKIFTNEDREPLKDLDALPFPARELRLKRGYEYKNRLTINRDYDLMYFGRGCFGKCTFCCEPYFSKSKQRYRSPERTFDEIKEIYEFHGRKPLRILISDPNIMGQPRKVERLAELLIESDMDVTFQVMSRTETIVKHPKIVEKMIRGGMISWELGIESSVQDDLDITDKHIPLEKQIKAVSILRNLGGETLGTYVIGLESHTKEFIKSLPDHAREIGCSASAFGIATPFPGTGFWDQMAAKDYIFETNWAKFDENNCVIKHPTMSPSDIENLRSWCMGKFWNLDTVVEQLRLDQVRVGKFRLKYKPTINEFLTAVGRKLTFAVSAGAELAEKGSKSNKENYMGSLKSIVSAWVNPRVEEYFKKHPMHEVIDMRQFGKLFKNKKFQVILDDPVKKTCLFALNITITKNGIDQIKVSKKPEMDYDFLLRANIDVLWVPPNLTPLQGYMNIASTVLGGRLKIKGWRYLIKMVLFGMKEALTAKFMK